MRIRNCDCARTFGLLFTTTHSDYGHATWTAANVRSFSYLLPDTVELALYLCLAAYFAIQLQQQA
jgi:hypothetical protein